MLTLWDLLAPIARIFSPPKPQPPARPVQAKRRHPPKRKQHPAPLPARAEPSLFSSLEAKPKRPPTAPAQPATSAQERYDLVVRAMLAQYKIKVRRWRSAMSGIAWQVTYNDGSMARFIESPKPKGPMSVAVFLHEIGHHAIGFEVYKPRCLEEYHAWRWSLEAMDRHGLNITDAVRYRMHLSLWYAVAKARRRGIKKVPDELLPYVNRPVKPKKTTDR